MSKNDVLQTTFGFVNPLTRPLFAAIDFSTPSSGEIFGGNRCGHSPYSPRLYQRDAAKKSPADVLSIAMQKIEEYYYAPWDHLRFLSHKDRQKRTERREAIATLLRVMIDHLHLATMTVALFMSKNQCRAMRNCEIAKKSGLDEKRFQRALTDLKNAGYIDMEYRYQSKIITTERGEEKTVIRAKPAIKRLSKRLFTHLGISLTKLDRCIDHAKKHWERTNRKFQENREDLAALLGRSTDNKKPPRNPLPVYKETQIRQEHENRVKQYIEQLQALKKKHPNIAHADIINRLGPFPGLNLDSK